MKSPISKNLETTQPSFSRPSSLTGGAVRLAASLRSIWGAAPAVLVEVQSQLKIGILCVVTYITLILAPSNAAEFRCVRVVKAR